MNKVFVGVIVLVFVLLGVWVVDLFIIVQICVNYNVVNVQIEQGCYWVQCKEVWLCGDSVVFYICWFDGCGVVWWLIVEQIDDVMNVFINMFILLWFSVLGCFGFVLY